MCWGAFLHNNLDEEGEMQDCNKAFSKTMHLACLYGGAKKKKKKTKINDLLYLFVVGLAEIGFVNCSILMWFGGEQ